MGLLDILAKITGADKMAAEAEVSMASDPETPTDLLRIMAEKDPALRSTIRENPACPPELAAWIDRQTS